MAPNFFISSLRAVKEIPALKSLEMPNTAEREFFSVTTPHNQLLGGFAGRGIGS